MYTQEIFLSDPFPVLDVGKFVLGSCCLV
uniref:Uncharacterized protein n=1 Tax=Musa acuminata subsp. malaccensis TaxID=214687 RepID=A0A804KJ57_MUSAM